MISAILLAADDLPADYGKAAPVGLFVLLALGVVVFFLARSMIKHVRKVPPSFTRDAAAPEPGSESTSASAGATKDPASTDPAPGATKPTD